MTSENIDNLIGASCCIIMMAMWFFSCINRLRMINKFKKNINNILMFASTILIVFWLLSIFYISLYIMIKK